MNRRGNESYPLIYFRILKLSDLETSSHPECQCELVTLMKAEDTLVTMEVDHTSKTPYSDATQVCHLLNYSQFFWPSWVLACEKSSVV